MTNPAAVKATFTHIAEHLGTPLLPWQEKLVDQFFNTPEQKQKYTTTNTSWRKPLIDALQQAAKLRNANYTPFWIYLASTREVGALAADHTAGIITTAVYDASIAWLINQSIQRDREIGTALEEYSPTFVPMNLTRRLPTCGAQAQNLRKDGQ